MINFSGSEKVQVRQYAAAQPYLGRNSLIQALDSSFL